MHLQKSDTSEGAYHYLVKRKCGYNFVNITADIQRMNR